MPYHHWNWRWGRRTASVCGKRERWHFRARGVGRVIGNSKLERQSSWERCSAQDAWEQYFGKRWRGIGIHCTRSSNIQHTTYNMQHATCNIQHALQDNTIHHSIQYIILSPMRSLESAECVKGTCQVEAVVSLVPKKFTENVEHKENTNLLQTFIEVFLNYIDQ